MPTHVSRRRGETIAPNRRLNLLEHTASLPSSLRRAGSSKAAEDPTVVRTTPNASKANVLAVNRFGEDASWSPQAPVPVVLNRFIGRRAELVDLVELVGRQRLVTIVGPGGCGKTRLAIETLSAVRSSGGSVGWVDLAPVSDAGRVAEVAATAFGVPVGPGAGPTGALVAMLRDQQCVIAFDNCEHVLPACADLIERLLEACPGVVVLATSRERLAVAAEAVWRVPSMADNDVVELFAERARAVRNDFVVDDANSEAVQMVCQRLDGIPLAVELAAAWVRILTPSQIAAALDDRFRLLVATPSRRVPRQQTLAASVEWSYGLLREPARVLLRRLAVFAGGFTIASAEAVCSDELLPVAGILDAMSRLVDTSIVVVGERGGEARFQLPETIRQFATDRIVDADEWSAMRDRHLDHVLAVSEQLAELFDHGNQDEARRAFDADYDNVLAALEWGLADSLRHVKGRRVAAAMVRHWFVHAAAGHGISMIERAIAAAPDDRTDLQARLYCGLALVAMPAGRLQLLHDAVELAQSLAVASGDVRTAARATAIAGYEYFYTDYARAVALGREAQRQGNAAGDAFAVDFGMLLEAVALFHQDRFDEVAPIADALLERCEARNERFAAAFSQSVAMYVAVLTGDVPRGVELGRHAVRLAAPLGDYLTAGTNVANLAWACGVAGLVDEGRRMMEGVARMIAGADADADVIDMHTTIGTLELLAGDAEAAVRWLDQAVTFSVDGVADNWTVARALPSLASAHRRSGRLDTAAATARRGVDMAARLGTWHMHAE